MTNYGRSWCSHESQAYTCTVDVSINKTRKGCRSILSHWQLGSRCLRKQHGLTVLLGWVPRNYRLLGSHPAFASEVSRVQGFREERIPQEGPWRGLCNKTFVVNEVWSIPRFNNWQEGDRLMDWPASWRNTCFVSLKLTINVNVTCSVSVLKEAKTMK